MSGVLAAVVLISLVSGAGAMVAAERRRAGDGRALVGGLIVGIPAIAVAVASYWQDSGWPAAAYCVAVAVTAVLARIGGSKTREAGTGKR